MSTAIDDREVRELCRIGQGAGSLDPQPES